MKTTIIFLITFGISLAKPIQDASPQLGGKIVPSYCVGDEFDFDCGEGELRTRCISSFWICDHVYDCSTGADEVKCSYLHQCPIGNFMCPNGDCILANKRCDGRKDCLDGSDERACFVNTIPERMSSPSSQHSSSGQAEGFASDNNPQFTRITGQHQAEPIIGERDDSGISAWTIIFGCTLIISLVILVTFWTLRRYPHTASHVDRIIKDITPRNVHDRLMRKGSPSRVNIVVPPNNDQSFDNPLNNAPLPLMVNIPGTSSASVYPSE